MVALIEDDFCRNPRTLCDWVQNFRIKKNQMKRKLRGAAGGDLRVRAVLTLALQSAEQELQQKQQERFKRWLELQSKCEYGANIASCNSKLPANNLTSAADVGEFEKVRCKNRDDIDNLWKNELSGLDQFMKNLSNQSYKKQQQEHRCNAQTAVAS